LIVCTLSNQNNGAFLYRLSLLILHLVVVHASGPIHKLRDRDRPFFTLHGFASFLLAQKGAKPSEETFLSSPTSIRHVELRIYGCTEASRFCFRKDIILKQTKNNYTFFSKTFLLRKKTAQ